MKICKSPAFPEIRVKNVFYFSNFFFGFQRKTDLIMELFLKFTSEKSIFGKQSFQILKSSC